MNRWGINCIKWQALYVCDEWMDLLIGSHRYEENIVNLLGHLGLQCYVKFALEEIFLTIFISTRLPHPHEGSEGGGVH